MPLGCEGIIMKLGIGFLNEVVGQPHRIFQLKDVYNVINTLEVFLESGWSAIQFGFRQTKARFNE